MRHHGSLETERVRLRADRRLVHRFWDGMSLSRMAPLVAAVFFLFGALGFLVDALQQGRGSPLRLIVLVLLCGGVAVGCLLAGVRRRYAVLPFLFAVQIGIMLALTRWMPASGPPSSSEGRRVLDASAAIAGLSVGYTLVMVFISREGLRRVRREAEIALASEIHAALVPPVAIATPGCEMYGRSLPATEVGGDLVDAIVVDDRALGIIADVSGHGVPAGTLMGALKAAVRTRLRTPGDLAEVLADVNDLLAELTAANTFATAAVLSVDSGTRASYTLAGHLPILHFRCAEGRVTRLGERGMALGILSGETFPVTQVPVTPGDVLAVLTDGFTETADARDEELGFEPLERTLAAHAAEPLPELFTRMVEDARQHGPQLDDRTLLLARVLG